VVHGPNFTKLSDDMGDKVVLLSNFVTEFTYIAAFLNASV